MHIISKERFQQTDFHLIHVIDVHIGSILKKKMVCHWRIFRVCLGSTETKSHCKGLLCIWAMMKHFYPDEDILFLDDNMAIHREQRPTKMFAEFKYDVNHMLRRSQATDLNPIKHLWEILD